MIPLFVLLGAFALLRLAGALGVRLLRSTRLAATFALAAMFAFTGLSHFAPSLRADFARMVPAAFGAPELWVAFTGIAELAGAVGLLIPRTRRLAAAALALLLVAVFPANVHAALSGVTLGGSAATALWIRAPMQVLYVAWAVALALPGAHRVEPRDAGPA